MEFNTDIRRMDVMVVDPDKVSRGNLSALARDFGCYEIRPFDNHEEAVVSIINRPPKVCFVAWGQRGEVPHGVLREIRCDPRDPVAVTPIVIVTPTMNRSILSQGIHWGATQFLSLPLVPTKFKDSLLFVLKDKRDVVRKGGRVHYVAPEHKPRKPKQTIPEVKIMEFPDPAKAAKPGEDPDDEDVLEI